MGWAQNTSLKRSCVGLSWHALQKGICLLSWVCFFSVWHSPIIAQINQDSTEDYFSPNKEPAVPPSAPLDSFIADLHGFLGMTGSETLPVTADGISTQDRTIHKDSSDPSSASPSHNTLQLTMGATGSQFVPMNPDEVDASWQPIDLSKRRNVALFLPLSGPYKALGQTILGAVELGAFNMAPPEMIWEIYDTQGTPEGAREAFKAMTRKGSAGIILGPIFSKEVHAIQSWVADSGLNMITLSNDEALASPHVFVFGMSPQQYVMSLNLFLEKEGVKHLIVITPASPYGRSLQQNIRYHMRGVNLTLIELPLGSSPQLTNAQLEQLKGIAFGAIWLPGWGKEAISLASHLRFNLSTIPFRFIGGEDWYESVFLHDPSLKEGWFVAAPPQSREKFITSYKKEFGTTPESLALIAYDAASLLSVLALGHPSAPFTKDVLLSPEGFKTLGGYCRFMANGLVERRLPLLQIMGQGKIKVRHPAPAYPG